jgi:NAD-dependent deacetylase
MTKRIRNGEQFREVAQLIKTKGNAVAFTGAGISVDSGIPAFRGGQGLWEKYDPMEYAHINAFHQDPEKVWVMLREMSSLIFEALPNAAHVALGELERKGLLHSVITQNIDGLHHIAGNSNVIEYHGNHRWLVCIGCGKRVPLGPDVLNAVPFPRCERCDVALKPDVVFFGEGIPMMEVVRANEAVNHCSVMIIIGTSGAVYPAAEIPYSAKAGGATVIEVNTDTTPFTSTISDYFLEGSAAEIMPALLKHLE